MSSLSPSLFVMSPSAFSGDLPIGSKSGQPTAGITNMQESAESDSSAALLMLYTFGSDRLASRNRPEPQQIPNDEHRSTQFCFELEMSNAVPPPNSKQPNSAVGVDFAVMLQSPWIFQSKRQRTMPVVREDPCCSCSASASCSDRRCPCAIVRVPCTDCDPCSKRCSNTTTSLNLWIDKANRRANSTTLVKFRKRFGLEPCQKLPRIQDLATPAGLSGDLDPLDLEITEATLLFPITGGTTVNRDPAIGW